MFNKIKGFKQRLNSSKDGKAVASNFGYLFIMQIAGYIFPLLTIPYLARVIGVEGFGKIAFATAVIVWFQTITDWGFSYTATRDVARDRDNIEKVSEIFSSVLWAKVILASISFIILYILTEVIPYLNENQLILFISFFLVPAKILFADWFFQAIEKMKFITVFDFFSKAIFTICVFCFIDEKSDFILHPLFLSVCSLFVGAISFILIIIKYKIKIKKIRFKKIYITIFNSKDVFINNIVPNFYNSFSSIFLGVAHGSIANGILDAGTKFSNIAQQFVSIIARVFFPFLSRNPNKHAYYAKINICSAILVSIILFLLSPVVVKLFFTPEFYDAIQILKITSFSLIFLALSNVYGLNYMIINGHERQLRNITLISSLIGFIISIPLIKIYSFLGAAFTLTFCRGIIGLSTMYAASRIKKGKK